MAGPFCHGTKASLSVGDLLTAAFRSNYRDSVVVNHIHFTTLPGKPALQRNAPGRRQATRLCRGSDGEIRGRSRRHEQAISGQPDTILPSRQTLEVVGELEALESCGSAFIQQSRKFIESGAGEIIN